MSELPLLTMAEIQKYEQQPLQQRFPLSSIPQLLAKSAADYGDDIAVDMLATGAVDEAPQSTSYREFHRKVLRGAQMLRECGFVRGDVLSLLLTISTEAQILGFAAQCEGIANPLNSMLEPEHLAGIVNAAGSTVLAVPARKVAPDLWPKVQYVLDHCPSIHTLVVVGNTDEAAASYSADLREGIRVCDFRKLNHCAEIELNEYPKATDIAGYFHTGGTTGRPKIAKLSHGNFTFISQFIAQGAAHFGRYTQLNGLPLFHIYGSVVSGLSAFVAGNRVVHLTGNGFRSPLVLQNFWHLVARHKASLVPVVPTLFAMLMNADRKGLDLSCLREVVSGAAPLPQGTKKQFEQEFSSTVLEGYGMTESCCLISRAAAEAANHADPDIAIPAGAVGLRLPYCGVLIADTESDESIEDNGLRICEVGKVGSILISGPNVFDGYLQSEDNAGIWLRDVDGKRWFDTGDCGYLDARGYLHIVGRVKDLIIRGGHNIDPAVIEVALRKHRSVAEVVAVGMPDVHAGELPVVFVRIAKGELVAESELLDYAAEHIKERAAVPKRIFIVEEMPMTAVGKIFKPQLRRQATEIYITELLENQSIYGDLSVRFIDSRMSVEFATTQVSAAEKLLGKLPFVVSVTKLILEDME